MKCTGVIIVYGCRGGGTGRRNGLKIRWSEGSVWVRFPSPAPWKQKKQVIHIEILRIIDTRCGVEQFGSSLGS